MAAQMAQALSQPAFKIEEGVGLVVAIALHAALFAVLALQFLFAAPKPFTSERVTVSLATEVSLESTAPDPVPESRAAIAPTLSDEPAPEAAPDEAQSEPQNTTTPPPPSTRSNTRQASSQPAPNRERTRPDRTRPSPTPTRSAERSGGSRIGDDFLPGTGGSTRTDDTRLPASQIGRSARASIVQSISRQLEPYWDAPPGLDADQLVTILAFRLNEDGTLAGRPQVVSQSGITDSNRPQAPLHAERAIRAVQRAAPFDLPDEYYNVWKNIRGARFDRNL